jgi:hypothetical protein
MIACLATSQNLKSQHFEMFINNFYNILRLFVAMWATCSKPKLPHGQCSQFSKKMYNNNNNNRKNPYSHIPIHHIKNWLLMVPMYNWCQTLSTSLQTIFKIFFIFPWQNFVLWIFFEFFFFWEFQKFWKWYNYFSPWVCPIIFQ